MTDDDNGNDNGDYNDHYNDDDTDGNYELQTYVLHTLLGGLVYPLTSCNLRGRGGGGGRVKKLQFNCHSITIHQGGHRSGKDGGR